MPKPVPGAKWERCFRYKKRDGSIHIIERLQVWSGEPPVYYAFGTRPVGSLAKQRQRVTSIRVAYLKQNWAVK